MRMQAKLRLNSVASSSFTSEPDIGKIYQEDLRFSAVGLANYAADGSDENNTYAKWTPMAELRMTVQNPALLGQFSEGQEFYVTFTLVEPSAGPK